MSFVGGSGRLLANWILGVVRFRFTFSEKKDENGVRKPVLMGGGVLRGEGEGRIIKKGGK